MKCYLRPENLFIELIRISKCLIKCFKTFFIDVSKRFYWRVLKHCFKTGQPCLLHARIWRKTQDPRKILARKTIQGLSLSKLCAIQQCRLEPLSIKGIKCEPRNIAKRIKYSQTRMKETHRAVRKEFLLSIVSYISCPINVESLTCIKAKEEWKRFLYPNVSFIRVSFIRVRLYSRNCLIASRFVTLKILPLKPKWFKPKWLVRSYRRLANKHQLLLCDLLLSRFYCTVVSLRIQAAACSDFLRSDFAAYIRRIR